MRFCVPVPCFFGKLDFCDAVKNIADLGFDACETYDWKNLDFEKVKSTLEENKVELLSMCTTEFNMTDPKFRTAWLKGLEESVIAASKLGVGKLITQVGQDTGEDRAFQHNSIVEALDKAKSILDGSGVTVMIEPLNIYVDHKGYYLWSAYEAFDIIRKVNSPNVKVVYDIYHQQIMEGNIIPAVTENLDCIAHLHCAAHPGRVDLQYGENDYKNIFAAIDKSGYSGACGLEYNPKGDSIQSLKVFKELYL